jgi:hypothetical protein
MRSLGYDIVFLILAVIAAGVIWSLINMSVENWHRGHRSSPKRRKSL